MYAPVPKRPYDVTAQKTEKKNSASPPRWMPPSQQTSPAPEFCQVDLQLTGTNLLSCVNKGTVRVECLVQKCAKNDPCHHYNPGCVSVSK